MNKTLLRAAVAAYALATVPAFAAEPAHWGYAGHGGPAHWAELDTGFQTCKLGQHQSPINIETRKVKAAEAAQPIGFAYTAGPAEVVNNGHTVQVNLAAGGSATFGGSAYKLVQFHFHTPSEERIDGKAYPLVAHLVHKNEQGQLAVVAVLFKTGRANAALKPVFAQLPAAEGSSLKLEAFDPAALLPVERGHYAFTGSLTTPPCSEEVRWQVLKTPVQISAAQLVAFKKLYKMNARPVQPLNGREVVLQP